MMNTERALKRARQMRFFHNDGDDMNLTLNWVEMELVGDSFKIYPSPPGQRDTYRADKRDFVDPSKLAFSRDDKFYWNFTGRPQEAVAIDYFNSSNITKHYMSHVLKRYLSKCKSLLWGFGFIGDTIAYMQDSTIPMEYCSVYDEYPLRFLYDADRRAYYMVISYAGKIIVLKKDLAALPEVPRDLIKRVRYKNRLVRYGDLLPDEQKDEQSIYLVPNRTLATYTGVDPHQVLFRKDPNRYKSYYSTISEFYRKYLSGKLLDNSIRIADTGFKHVPPEKVMEASTRSNLLAFGHEQTSFNVYTGIKQHGPLFIPDVGRLRYIFIFHKDDRDLANQLYSYLNGGLKGFPGLEAFVGLPFNVDLVDSDKTIRYESEEPAEEIKGALQLMAFNPHHRYLAIYISRIHRDDPEHKKRQEYYKIKEALLKKNIVSQAIWTKSIESPNFNYYLPNIAIAMLAKIGGKAWKLARPVQRDLIVGIGAYKHSSESYIGNAICFANDGSFEEFDAFHRRDVEALGRAFRDALLRFVKTNRKANRLIIHFFKEMSTREERGLLGVLGSLSLSLPYVVLTLRGDLSGGIVVFDEEFPGKMPVSGTIIQIRQGDYLLCNNSRYERKTPTRIDDYPLPVRVTLSKSRGVDTDSPESIRDLLDQVYQFSRMYWRTIKQKGKPVTIGYSRIIAKMVAHFENKTLPDTQAARKSLWFL